MRRFLQYHSRLNKCLWLVLLLSVLTAMVAAASHVHTKADPDHGHCSLCQVAAELVATGPALVFALWLVLAEFTLFVAGVRRFACWKPRVPYVRPPPALLIA